MHVLALSLFLISAVGDEEAVYRALDKGDVPALSRYETGRLLRIVRRGRPVRFEKRGQYSEQATDAFGRTTEVIFRVPGHYRPGRAAGVLILLHGLGGSGRQLLDLYRTFAEREGLILVSPTAQKPPEKPRNEDAPPFAISGRFPHWWSYRDGNFAFTALSLVKRRYSVDENRVYLSGYSMGGFGTWNIGLRYPDRFAALVPFAGGLSRWEYTRRTDDRIRSLARNARDLPIYFVHGDRDQTVPVRFDRATRDQLKELGYAFVYDEVKGGRHVIDVREGTPIMGRIQKWLRPKKRNAHPRIVDHHFLGAYCSRAYWVRMDDFSNGPAQVRAEVKDQRIEFTSTGASRVTFFVDEALLDLAKPIRVMREGRTLFRGRVRPSAAAVAESWKGTEDRDLVYRAKITVTLDGSAGER